MNSNIFKIYNERLYELKYGFEKNINTTVNVSFTRITVENYALVEKIRGRKYVKDFKRMLQMNDFGVYAYIDDNLVGYGWAKLKGSRDYFYKIDNCYLCRFYVASNFRGLNIYPTTIKELMNQVNDKFGSNIFFIAVENTNLPSIKGISKLGFNFINEKRFTRFCKITINKFDLKYVS